MKTLIIVFAVLLFLLTLLASFGGSIRPAETFYQAMDEQALLREKEMLERQLKALENIDMSTTQAPSDVTAQMMSAPPVAPPVTTSEDTISVNPIEPTTVASEPPISSAPPAPEMFLEKFENGIPEPYVSDEAFGYIQ